MKTASFFTYKGHVRISIARYWPRFTPSGCHYYPSLTLGPWFYSVEPAEYLERYGEILAQLDPLRVGDHLHELAGEHEPVLLCWERPPLTPENWCDRRLVAQWFRETLGHEVDELMPVPKTGPQLSLL